MSPIFRNLTLSILKVGVAASLPLSSYLFLASNDDVDVSQLMLLLISEVLHEINFRSDEKLPSARTKERRNTARRLSGCCRTSHLSFGRRSEWWSRFETNSHPQAASKQRRTESVTTDGLIWWGDLSIILKPVDWTAIKGLSFKIYPRFPITELGSPQSFPFETAINHSNWFAPPPTIPVVSVDETNFVISMN